MYQPAYRLAPPFQSTEILSLTAHRPQTILTESVIAYLHPLQHCVIQILALSVPSIYYTEHVPEVL
jgi:hypothetical protein